MATPPKLFYVFDVKSQEQLDYLSATNIEIKYKISLRNVYNAVTLGREFNGCKLSLTEEFPETKITPKQKRPERKTGTRRGRSEKVKPGFFNVNEVANWIIGGSPYADY